MQTKNLTSVTEFHAAVRSKWNGHFVYRGERSDAYVLRSKWGRAQVQNPKNGLSYEKAVLAEFKRRAASLVEHPPANDLEWLAVAQHHGLPTRLLDWTQNPLVAAYFATEQIATGDAVIYTFDRYDLPTVHEGTDPFTVAKDSIYLPRHASKRFIAQQGLFVLQRDPSQAVEAASLERWVLKKDFLAELSGTAGVYGITASTMFPDLGGLCEEMTKHWVWR